MMTYWTTESGSLWIEIAVDGLSAGGDGLITVE
jgi:hypothetical protein